MSMTNGEKEESSPQLASNLSSYSSSCSTFILLTGIDGVIDGVLFDANHIEDPLYDYVNFIFLFFLRLSPEYTPCV